MKYDRNEMSGGLFPNGEYDAVVSYAKEKFSKSGNEMIELRLTVYDGARTTTVYHYLLPQSYTFGQFLDAIGKTADQGDLTEDDCVGHNLRVTLAIEKQEGYADKNKVVTFGKPLAGTSSNKAHDTDNFDPFET